MTCSMQGMNQQGWGGGIGGAGLHGHSWRQQHGAGVPAPCTCSLKPEALARPWACSCGYRGNRRQPEQRAQDSPTLQGVQLLAQVQAPSPTCPRNGRARCRGGSAGGRQEGQGWDVCLKSFAPTATQGLHETTAGHSVGTARLVL